jgi:hypothetical protein
MRDNILLIIALLAVAGAFMYFDTGENYRVYDCGMAEWHPDIPQQVKEECRRRSLENWREQQKKLSA